MIETRGTDSQTGERDVFEFRQSNRRGGADRRSVVRAGFRRRLGTGGGYFWGPAAAIGLIGGVVAGSALAAAQPWYIPLAMASTPNPRRLAISRANPWSMAGAILSAIAGCASASSTPPSPLRVVRHPSSTFPPRPRGDGSWPPGLPPGGLFVISVANSAACLPWRRGAKRRPDGVRNRSCAPCAPSAPSGPAPATRPRDRK